MSKVPFRPIREASRRCKFLTLPVPLQHHSMIRISCRTRALSRSSVSPRKRACASSRIAWLSVPTDKGANAGAKVASLVAFGVNALRGLYAAFGGAAQRVARGFIVFREDHWFFAGTGLGYADLMGDDGTVFGYEVDGLEYEFVEGLPTPTFADGAPEGTSILAMNWATPGETGLDEHAGEFMIGDGDAIFASDVLDGSASPKNVDRRSRTSGMIVHFTRGRGEVLTVGGTEWVNGLRIGDFYVEKCTRNVLDHFLRDRRRGD